MYIIIGLLIIAVGAFCQSSSYVPITRVKEWSWESFWLVQGVFAWLVFPFLGALLAVPEGKSLSEIIVLHSDAAWKTILCGMLWGVGGLTFGLSMRYLGIALGQSIALGTCAALGTILGPVFTGEASSLTFSVIIGVCITLVGIAVIGVAGGMKSKTMGEDGEKEAVKEFNFTKGIAVALLCGLMSACFAIGIDMGKEICFPSTPDIFRTLPATFLVTLGGFVTNVAYCLYQNFRNSSFNDYSKVGVWGNNALFCCLAGVLWYSQFFGLSLGKGFLADSPVLLTFSWCILMALNVTFSNVWGIILNEWKGTTRATKVVLVAGIIILIISSFLPQLLS